MRFSLDDLKGAVRKRTAGRRARQPPAKKPCATSPVPPSPLALPPVDPAPQAEEAQTRVEAAIVELDSASPTPTRRELAHGASSPEPPATRAALGVVSSPGAAHPGIQPSPASPSPRRSSQSGPGVVEIQSRVHEDASVFEEEDLALDLLNLIRLPRDQKRREGWGPDDVFANSVRHLHGLIHGVTMAKRQAEQFARIQADLRGKAIQAEQEARLAEGLLSVSEAREAKLKEELAAFKDDALRAKLQLKRKEDELLLKTEHAVELERRLADSASREICWESQVFSAKERAAGAEKRAQEAESVARTALAEAEAAKQSATRAVEDFRSSAELKAEVEEAVCDAYVKGFTEYKAQVQELYSDLDLRGVTAEGTEEAEGGAELEEEGENEEAAEPAEEAVDPTGGPTSGVATATEMEDVIADSKGEAEEDPVRASVARAMAGFQEAIVAVGAAEIPPPQTEDRD